MLCRTVLIVAATVAAMQFSATAEAVEEFPFTITSPRLGGSYAIQCTGPWYRSSGCNSFGATEENDREFYRAEDGLFSAIGRWGCTIYKSNECKFDVPKPANVTFCGPGGRNNPKQVHLTYDGGSSLTVNQTRLCGVAAATSVLGHDGEDANGQQDRDVFDFPGKAGQDVEVRLERSQAGGSTGEVATLRVLTPSGSTLGKRTGELPLSLKLRLPGAVVLDVLREGGKGVPFRGYYTLQIIAASGDLGDRLIRPRETVEQ